MFPATRFESRSGHVLSLKMATLLHPVVLRRKIRFYGIVQGVGFRPFVFQLALRNGIGGFVLNTSSGLTIEAEGTEAALEAFLHSLCSNPPPLARIDGMSTEELDAIGEQAFEIRESDSDDSHVALVSPDMSSCSECLAEVADPQNRRFAYPFTNCTNCGPRYTIIRNIPYDRRNTTMAEFRMCPECEAEYRNPASRRFHAQPNACSRCGPALHLVQSGSEAAYCAASRDSAASLAILRQVRSLLRGGAILAIKGLGGFQLACDAENEAAVRLLRRRKKRSEKPFALMARDLRSVEKICAVSHAEACLLSSPERPIVVLRRRPGGAVASDVAPGNDTLGFMLAYSPLHVLLFGESPSEAPEFDALVMTSGNISDEPIVISNEGAWQRLQQVADWFLFHDRRIYMRVDDSVARVFNQRPLLLRRSRSYVPQPIELGCETIPVLACGAELKNTFCLTTDRYAILSQHIGDLENYETLEFFRETLANLQNLFRIDPQAVAFDLHPRYLSSRFAQELPLPKVPVQHHHAHIASCMAENRLEGRVVGVAFDGTGFGTDGQIWGGEFLTASYREFVRRAHILYIPLAGGDAAVRQIWRSALGWLQASFGEDLPLDLPLFRHVPEGRVRLVSRMLAQGINTVSTSSCGRLSDAVASLIGLRQEVSFEAQAAIELEIAATGGSEELYGFRILAGDPEQVDLRPAIREIVRDLRRGEAPGKISARFHNTLAQLIVVVCQRIRERERLDRVCLSGGTFQNTLLLQRAMHMLEAAGFRVFVHSAVPPNDGGIALGQALIANELLRSGG